MGCWSKLPVLLPASKQPQVVIPGEPKSSGRASSNVLVTTLFAVTLFAGAFLLFALEPMFGKMLLPLFGGSPAVWNTSLVFYQLVLLAGYAYANLLQRRLTILQQTFVHGALVVAALLFLPTALPGWIGDPTRSPVSSLLRVAAATVGVPFFVLAGNSSLLQAWFARVRPRSDAYALYAASNLGSMLGLLTYTFAVEPFTGLGLQSRFWQAGYLLFAVLLTACAFATPRRREERIEACGAVDADGETAPTIKLRRIARWVILAAVPSSLMLGVTAYLQDAVAAIPLLWTLPLVLYIATFVIAFGLRRFVSRLFVARAAAVGLVAVACIMATGQGVAIELAIAVNVVTFFLLALYCHTTLRDDRPPEGLLTQFYLWLAAGGAIGGMFNVLVAPQIFPIVIEYPLALVIGALFLSSGGRSQESRAARILGVAAPLIAGIALLLLIAMPKLTELKFAVPVVFVFAGLLALSVVRNSLRFASALAVMFAFALYLPSTAELYQVRNFFGVKHVLRAPGYHLFTHGGTLHGAESTLIPHEREPLTYFERTGPIGALFAQLQHKLRRAHIAVAGLGIGTLACYVLPGQTWTFYEIDPEVVQIASNSDLFRYLSACMPKARIVLGDARLSLAREANHDDALLILDAYTSDQMPVHLLTREAFAVYLNALTPHGVLAFDVSNRFFDLRPVIANLAANAGLVAYDRVDARYADARRDPGWSSSHWIVVARSDGDLAGLERQPSWRALTPNNNIPLWTDDYSSQIRILTQL